MSKRKSGAEHANQANKRVKAPSEADEMLKRALEMQDDFEDGSDSESEGSDEEEGSSQESVSEEEDEEAVEEDEETPAVPIAESSKSAQDRLLSILKKSRPLHPSQPTAALNSLQETLRRVKSLIEAIPSVPPASPAEAQKKLKRSVPYPEALHPTLKEVNWKVAFDAPQRINVVGLWPAGAAIKIKDSGFVVDMAIEMPADLFTERDTKDYRYFAKRAFYLSVIEAALLKDADLRKPLGSVSVNKVDDELRPYLQCSTSNNLTLNIRPACPADVFAAAKLAPERNNVRLQDFAPATPLYNASLLADTLLFDDLELFVRCASRSAHFADAARLAQLWTRSLGWSSQLVLYSLAYLVDAKGGLATTPVGLFGSTLEWLVREDWERPVGWKEALDSSYAKSLSKTDKVLMHPSGRINLLSDLTEAQLELLRVEANRALQVLRRSTTAGMDQLFPISPSHKLPTAARFDCTLTLTLSASTISTLSKQFASTSPDTAARPVAALHQHLYSTLRRALGTRIKALYVSSPSSSTQIGLVYQSGEATRLVDHGPSASDEAACAVFRDFWGDKSEMRRFKDGSIVEACVWEASTVLSRFSIPEQIVGYILSHKYGISPGDLSTSSQAFHELVQEPAAWRQRLYQADPEVKGFSAVMTAYEELSSTLRGTEDLPLAIKAIAPASELLRYSSTFIPGARKTKQYFHLPESTSHVDAADLVITFEQSGKWPTDLQAVQKVKLAFLVKVSEVLKKSMGAATQCSAVFDPDASPKSENVVLEVLLPTGFAFRLHVFHEPEMALMGQASFDNPSLTKTLQSYRKSLMLRPKHHAAMVSLIHQYTALSGTTRLVKRWIACHLLSPHIGFEQIELICAYVFLRGNAPASPVHGFAQVLQLLATWSWHADPLLVPAFTASRREGSALDASSLGKSVEFPQDKALQIQTSFTATRQNDPAFNVAPWFVATEEDMTGRWWTSPSKMIAGRVKDLASAALQALREGVEAKTLFTSPTEIYEFSLRIKSNKSTRQHQCLLNPTPSSKTTATPATPQIPIDFNPAALFVQQAQSLLGDSAVLFWDEYGGTTVYGLFNPLLAKPRSWTPALDFPARPVAVAEGVIRKKSNKLMVELDKDALLGGLVRLSRDVVGSVSQ